MIDKRSFKAFLLNHTPVLNMYIFWKCCLHSVIEDPIITNMHKLLTGSNDEKTNDRIDKHVFDI